MAAWHRFPRDLRDVLVRRGEDFSLESHLTRGFLPKKFHETFSGLADRDATLPFFSVSRISIGPSQATNAERAYLVRTPERDSFL